MKKNIGLLVLLFIIVCSPVFGCHPHIYQPLHRHPEKQLSCEDWFNRGLIWYEKGNHDRAIRDFNKSLEINPHNALAYNSRGMAWFDKGDYDQAILDFNKAIGEDPNITEAYYNRGITWLDKGDYDQAIFEFNKVLEINPRLASAYYARGISYLLLNQSDSGCLDIQTACELGFCEGLRLVKEQRICP
jgi:tetratricopeptide (TPR) repeat protein